MSRGTRIELVGGCYGLTGLHVVLRNLHFLPALKKIPKQFIPKEHKTYIFISKLKASPLKGLQDF